MNVTRIPFVAAVCAAAVLRAAALDCFDGAAAVTASCAPGFYADPVSVALAYPDPAAEIHYTLDGSEPVASVGGSCRRYEGPLVLSDPSAREDVLALIPTNPSDVYSYSHNGKSYCWRKPDATGAKVNVVRARAFKGDAACTNEFAGTWLVGAPAAAHSLRVVSLQTDEANFFGYEQGLMVPGAHYTKWSGGVGKPYANYFQTGTNWERRVHFELFETNRARVVDCDLGVRMHGAYSRSWPQKTMSFFARDEYGKKHVKYPLFPDDANTRYKRFLLRNSGNDWNETTFRDAVSQAIFRPVAHHATQGYVPAVVYLNGEYWGLLNFRHQYGARFFAREYGADPDNVDYVKWSAGTGREAAEGDLAAYDDLIAYLNGHSAADPAVYAEIGRRIDLDNLIDYCLLHAYLAVTDWANNNNNVGLWREKVAYTNDVAAPHDGRWRFCSYDTDSGSALAGTKATDGIANAKKLPMFSALCANTNFTQRFVNRSADLLNTVLVPARAQAQVDAAAETIASEIPRHVARWPNLVSTMSWTNEVQKFRQFFADRPAAFQSHLNSHFAAGAVQKLTLEADGHGQVRVNSLATDDAVNPLALPWTGGYFANVPVSLRAAADYGWEFVGWDMGGATNTEEAITLAVTRATTVRAVFRTAQPPRLVVNEVMAESDDGDWFELFNAGDATANLRGCWLSDDSPAHLTRIADDVRLAPGAFLVVKAGAGEGLDTDGALQVPFGLGKKGDEIHLYSWDGTNELAAVSFSTQRVNVAEGRLPDGGDAWGTLGVATPGAPNRGPNASGLYFATGCSTQVWAGTSGFFAGGASTGTVETLAFEVTGGEAFKVRVRAGNRVSWYVPANTPKGACETVRLSWRGRLDGVDAADETTYILACKGPRPVIPSPAPTGVVTTVASMPGYVWGVYDASTPAAMTHVTTEKRLAFPGATLAELQGCVFGGWMDGGSMSSRGAARAYFTHAGTEADGTLRELVTTVQKYDDQYVKGVVVRLTEDAQGVWAQALTGPFLRTSSSATATTDFVTRDEKGEVAYQNLTGTSAIAATPTSGGYGLACFNAMKWLTAAAQTAFPGLTLDDLDGCTFTAVIAGTSTAPNCYTRVEAQNVVRETKDGAVTKIRLEMQHLSDGYVKCPIVTLVNGADGVQAQVVAVRYLSVANGAYVGYPFVKADGTYNGNKGVLSTSPVESGYGVAGLAASRLVFPPPSRTTVVIFR